MKIHSCLLILLPTILISGLLWAGIFAVDNGGNPSLVEGVEEVLVEIFEEECLCGSIQGIHLCSLLVKREHVAEQCSAAALIFSVADCSGLDLSCWRVPLRI